MGSKGHSTMVVDVYKQNFSFLSLDGALAKERYQ